jgi:hypothetical protein
METSDALDALQEIPEWYGDDGDFSGVEIALELLGTAIIRANLVDKDKARSASKLSKILKLISFPDDNGKNAVSFAEDIEMAISASSYGDFSENIIEDAEEAIESLINELEPWLKGLINEK